MSWFVLLYVRRPVFTDCDYRTSQLGEHHLSYNINMQCIILNSLFLASVLVYHTIPGRWEVHDKNKLRKPCLSVLCHRSCREGLIQHLHIGMLRKVVQPAKVTNELLQLLQKLVKINHKKEVKESAINRSR